MTGHNPSEGDIVETLEEARLIVANLPHDESLFLAKIDAAITKARELLRISPAMKDGAVRERILIALGGLRDNMTAQQIRTVQWFADQFPHSAKEGFGG